MQSTKRIKVSYGRTVKIGEFEFMRIDAGYEEDVAGELTEEVFKRAWAIVIEEVKNTVKERKRKLLQ